MGLATRVIESLHAASQGIVAPLMVTPLQGRIGLASGPENRISLLTLSRDARGTPRKDPAVLKLHDSRPNALGSVNDRTLGPDVSCGLYLYGAGYYAQRIQSLCIDNDIPILGIIHDDRDERKTG